MKSRVALAVGLLVLCVVGAGWALLEYVQEGIRETEGYPLYARFRDASGLFSKSRVQTAGIEIGKISSKELAERRAEDREPKAKVVFIIHKNVRVYENATIARRAASLLGEYYLEIDPGTATDAQGNALRVLAPGDEIRNVLEAVGTSDVIEQVGQTIPILREILVDVRRLTSGPIAEIAEGLNTTIKTNSEVLERLLKRVDNIAADIEDITHFESNDIKIALSNVREITESIKSLVGTSEGEVKGTGEKLQGTLDRLQSTVQKLERAMSNIEKITGQVAEGKGSLGRLVNDDEIAHNLEDVSRDVGEFVGGITRLQTVVGLRSEYNYLQSAFKNWVSIQLVPRPDKYYLIELVDDPRGFRREESDVFLDSQTGTRSVKHINISQQLRFSFMFAKRLGPVTGRFGILESTGGAGVDLHFLDDRLTLSVDMFDTRTNVYPRLRARAALAVYRNILWLTAGADDVLNHERGDAGGGAFIDGFFGAQLIFNDEDLKTLLLFGGSSLGSAARQ